MKLVQLILCLMLSTTGCNSQVKLYKSGLFSDIHLPIQTPFDKTQTILVRAIEIGTNKVIFQQSIKVKPEQDLLTLPGFPVSNQEIKIETYLEGKQIEMIKNPQDLAHLISDNKTINLLTASETELLKEKLPINNSLLKFLPDPDNIKLVDSTPFSVTLSWSTIGQPDAYLLYKDKNFLTFFSPQHTYYIDKLEPNQEYTVNILAMKGALMSRGVNIVFKTKASNTQEIPIHQPQNLRTIKKTDSEITVSWDHPDQYNRYIIQLDGTIIESNFKLGTYTFKSLEPDVTYFMNVQAITDEGPGTPAFHEDKTLSHSGSSSGSSGGGNNVVNAPPILIVPNQPPVINNLTATIDPVLGLNAPIRLFCDASDPDDILSTGSFFWSEVGGNSGNFSNPDGGEITWTAASSAGAPYTIRCSVTDVTNPAVEQTIDVGVLNGQAQLNFNGGFGNQ